MIMTNHKIERNPDMTRCQYGSNSSSSSAFFLSFVLHPKKNNNKFNLLYCALHQKMKKSSLKYLIITYNSMKFIKMKNYAKKAKIWKN